MTFSVLTVALACSKDSHTNFKVFQFYMYIMHTVKYHVQLFFIVFFHSLKELYFLECDVGQSEFTPPGLISLNRVCKPLLGRLLLNKSCQWHL